MNKFKAGADSNYNCFISVHIIIKTPFFDVICMNAKIFGIGYERTKINLIIFLPITLESKSAGLFEYVIFSLNRNFETKTRLLLLVYWSRLIHQLMIFSKIVEKWISRIYLFLTFHLFIIHPNILRNNDCKLNFIFHIPIGS